MTLIFGEHFEVVNQRDTLPLDVIAQLQPGKRYLNVRSLRCERIWFSINFYFADKKTKKVLV